MGGGGLEFYRQIDISGRRLVTGIRSIGSSLLLITRNWPPEPTADASSSSVVFLRLGDLIDNLHFTYPDFRAKLQSGLFYTFIPLVTGTTETKCPTSLGVFSQGDKDSAVGSLSSCPGCPETTGEEEALAPPRL